MVWEVRYWLISLKAQAKGKILLKNDVSPSSQNFQNNFLSQNASIFSQREE